VEGPGEEEKVFMFVQVVRPTKLNHLLESAAITRRKWNERSILANPNAWQRADAHITTHSLSSFDEGLATPGPLCNLCP
jgi:hypothetical protein